MEILAPAGNMEQAIAAINAGCNALYGGLKKWNARNRAENFSVEDYNSVIHYCHNYNCKFYLTLNTLLHDSEIEEIIVLFQSNRLTIPDAIIATDVGLIITLKAKFPQIPIHASTQFGAYSSCDLKFLETLGVQRVILPRELKFHEIEKICNETDLEIEVFVYGSQCISFSGQCLWGSLVGGGSGNRGRCIGMCRDIYQFNATLGQFMYPQDINALKMVGKLEEIGVSSIKIEGRMRSSDEISNVIQNLKNNEFDINNYCGYLSVPFTFKSMINNVNPRQKVKQLTNHTLSKNDLTISENSFRFASKEDFDLSYNFVKTMFTRPFSDEKPNILISPQTDNHILTGIDYINCYGERTFYKLDTKKTNITITLKALSHLFENNIKANIYEFSCKHPAMMNVLASQESLNEVWQDINNSLPQPPAPAPKNKTLYNLDKAVFMTENIDSVIKALTDKRIKKVIYSITSLSKLRELRKVLTGDEAVYYKLPVVNFATREDALYEELKGCNVMISKPSHLSLITEYNFGDVIADYTINCQNSFFKNYLKESGVTGLVLNPEISLEDNINIIKDSNVELYYIKYGRLPLGYTRYCFKEAGLCSCDKKFFSLENAFKGYKISIECYNELDVRKIMYEKPFFCLKDYETAWGIYIDEFPEVEKIKDCSAIYDRSVH